MSKPSVTIEDLLTKLENEVARDVTKRITQHSSGRSPKSSHAEALASICEVIEGVIGEDIPIGESRVIWDGNGGVKAENADDLREGWYRLLRAEQRARLSKVMGGENGDSK